MALVNSGDDMASAHKQLLPFRRGPLRVVVSILAVTLGVALICPNGARSQQRENEKLVTLELGRPIEREIAGGQLNFYLINALATQYVQVIVEQRGIDVALALSAPGGPKLIDCDRANGTEGVESMAIITEAGGVYGLEIRASLPDAATGKYVVSIDVMRGATGPDRSQVAAQMALAEGEQLQEKDDAESLRNAVQKYETALALYRSIENRAGEARTLHRIGKAYSDQEESPKALDYYGQALSLYQAAGERAGEAATLAGIGWVCHKKGENQEAALYLNQALSFFKASGDRRQEARALRELGLVYAQLGEKQTALDYYTRALPLVRGIGDRRSEASVLSGLGTLYDSLGDGQKALDYYSQSLPLHRAAGNRRGEGGTLTGMGWVYRRLGENRKALDGFTQALRLFQETGARLGEAYALLAPVGIYLELGEPQKALDNAKRALLIHRTLGDRRAEAYSLHTVGWIYKSLGEMQKALDSYKQALPLHRSTGDPQGEADTLTRLGRVYQTLGNRQKALEQFNQALVLNRRTGSLPNEIDVLFQLACLEREGNDLIAARANIETAISLTESVRATIGSQELRASYLASAQRCYEFYIDLLYELHLRSPQAGYAATALQVSERERARSLLELLAEARADIRRGLDRTLLEHERNLQQAITTRTDQRIRLLNVKHTDEQASAVERELETLITEYEQLQASVRMVDPRYAALTRLQAPTLSEIQQLLDGDTTLLEYALGEARSYVWAVTKDSIHCFVLPNRDVIEHEARRAYELLTARTKKIPGETHGQRAVRIRKADAQYNAAASRLSRLLLSPVASQLGNKRLLIVNDGRLQYIPFAALPYSGRPLILKHEIIYLPSAATLVHLRRDLEERPIPTKTVAIFADPVFEATDIRVSRAAKPTSPLARAIQNDRQLTDSAREDQKTIRDYLIRTRMIEEGQPLARLPYSRKEALAIASLVPEAQRRLLLDFNVNYQTATSADLGEYRYVHFATHGVLDTEHPELSGILLSLVDAGGRPQSSGILRLGEIYNLKLPVDLVSLSGCETALGRSVRGEGMVGLTRGFMYAGAPRVLASLWKVEEAATAELMSKFYGGVLGKRAQRPAEALRHAQIEMWRKPSYRAPYYWSGFVLQGEWR